MKITAISLQARDKNRVNVSVDGGYSFSLDISQVVDCGIKVNQQCDEERISFLKGESEFGKVYQRALEFSLLRPRSVREVSDYLFRKTFSKLDKNGDLKKGISKDLANRVLTRLIDRNYIDDHKFANFWIENRFMKKGISRRRLEAELQKKGVNSSVIASCFESGGRDDLTEVKKIIMKKRSKYSDDKKMIMYLMRQGFQYDDVKKALRSEED